MPRMYSVILSTVYVLIWKIGLYKDSLFKASRGAMLVWTGWLSPFLHFERTDLPFGMHAALSEKLAMLMRAGGTHREMLWLLMCLCAWVPI